MNCADVRDHAELYVVGAAESAAGEAIAAHLAECDLCRHYVQQLEPSVEALALTVSPVSLPSDSRQRLLDLAMAHPPEIRSAPVRPPAPVRPAPMRTPTRRSWATSKLDAWPRVATFAALGLLVLSGWLGMQYAQLQTEVRTARAELQRMREYEQAFLIVQQATYEGGAMVMVEGTEIAPGARGMVYAPRHGKKGVLTVSGLPPQPGEGYQLWLIRGETRMNGGYFEPEPSGKSLIMLDAPIPLDEFDAFGITNEQRGGSPAPQGQRYMWGRSKGA